MRAGERGAWGSMHPRAVHHVSVSHLSIALFSNHKLNLRDEEEAMVWALAISEAIYSEVNEVLKINCTAPSGTSEGNLSS